MSSITDENTVSKVRVEVKIKPNSGFKLSCPLPNMALWNMHPKVFLAPDEDNRAMCPYCGTVYYVSDE